MAFFLIQSVNIFIIVKQTKKLIFTLEWENTQEYADAIIFQLKESRFLTDQKPPFFQTVWSVFLYLPIIAKDRKKCRPKMYTENCTIAPNTLPSWFLDTVI